MAHPGFDFSRRSYHTLRNLSCPRRAYLNQMLGVRRVPGPSGDDSPFAAGKVFHSLMEVYYMPPRYQGQPLAGTDGHPALTTAEEVYDYYLERGVAANSIMIAKLAYLKYLEFRGADDELRSRILGRPEPDVVGDLRSLLPSTRKTPPKIPYAAQYDLVVRLHGGGVTGVEHKLLRGFYPDTLRSYLNSGQLVGQCAVWNSRPDLIEKFGRMDSIVLNLTFKDGKLVTHRESLYIPPTWQLTYVRAVETRTHALASLLSRYKRLAGRQQIDNLWPQAGLVNGECVGIGSTCEYLDVCQTSTIEPELYQITEAGRERAGRDKLVKVSPTVKSWEV